jgi:hypothetical protein
VRAHTRNSSEVDGDHSARTSSEKGYGNRKKHRRDDARRLLTLGVVAKGLGSGTIETPWRRRKPRR